MKFIHLADLHLGKSLHGVNLLESGDQPHWVTGFLRLCGEVRPDAVVIAGDVYDRSAPAAGAVELLNRLVTGLRELGAQVLIVPGNHDSPRRLAFGRELLAREGLHIAPPLTAPGTLTRVTLEDPHGPVDFWLLPYLFPALAEEDLGTELRDYDGALRALLAAQPLDPARRNVAVAHQNVTVGGAEGERGGSESMVGGIGQVDYTAFDAFDYAALGHIHAGYPVGRPGVRYAGSPLCYHFQEARQPAKGPLLVELGPKGTETEVTLLPIPPLHPLRALEGPFPEVREELAGRLPALQTGPEMDGRSPALQTGPEMDGRLPALQTGPEMDGRSPALQTGPEMDGRSPARQGEYLSITLTDRRVTPELADHLHALAEAKGSLLMELRSAYQTAEAPAVPAAGPREKGLAELFSEFYAQRSGGAAPDPAERGLLGLAEELAQRADLRLPPEPGQIEAILKLAGEEAAQ